MSNHTQRLQHFPVSLFASVMGTTGLSIAYQRYSHIIGIPSWIGFVLLTLANFFPAISISLLLLSIGFLEIHTTLALWLWGIGSSLHLTFTLIIISRWITENYDINHSNPAWFIPVVGNILVPIAGIQFVNIEISYFFFSIGLFFWLSLFTIVFYRIIFHHQLAQKFIPTLFILIAPPAIGFVSYVKLVGTIDVFAHFLLYVALFLTLLLSTMIPYFWRLKFFVSWWAYTFPLCAMTIASILAFNLLHLPFFAYLSTLLLASSTLIVAFVFYKTLEAIKLQTLCQPEE